MGGPARPRGKSGGRPLAGAGTPVTLGQPVEPAPSRYAFDLAVAVPGEDLIGVGADLEPGTLLSAYRQGTAVCLELEDNGAGMSAEEQAKIFDLFYSNRKGGTGLGLAIVERIARAHGGRIGVRSTQGEGTDVTEELPALPPSEQAEKEKGGHVGPPLQAAS